MRHAFTRPRIAFDGSPGSRATISSKGTRATSTCKSIRSSSGLDNFATYFATAASSQRQSLVRVPRNPQGQGRVALLRLVPLRLKAPKPKESDFQPQTQGEHIRKRRLALGLNKKQAAAQLGVTSATITHWESEKTHPQIDEIPAILRFLGYDPFPAPETIPERLLAKRRARGWSIREAARHLGVDPTTWGDWERGRVVLYRSHRALLAQLLGVPQSAVNRAMAEPRTRASTRLTKRQHTGASDFALLRRLAELVRSVRP